MALHLFVVHFPVALLVAGAAEARPHRDTGELTTDEARRMMERVRAFGRRRFVLTGGGPLERPDVVALVRHGTDLGLRVAMTPSGTPRMTPEVIADLKEAGLARLAVSLDGSRPEIHDAFRGVSGSFRVERADAAGRAPRIRAGGVIPRRGSRRTECLTRRRGDRGEHRKLRVLRASA